MTFVADLEPRALWGHFDTILTIPRGSREEERIREHVLALAREQGLEYQVDGVGNVVVRKPASPGKEGVPATILQSHLDMVNDKNSDVEHDFARDPIRPLQEGEYLTAHGTTLGSDNGIGLAAMLAIMESRELVHGPLELLFTVDEETGLTGAGGLDPSLLTGRRLLNLDSEIEGSVTVGCAGGADTELLLPLTLFPSPGGTAVLQVKLHGLKGGHSGMDIHLQRGNAIQLLARILLALPLDTPCHLADLQGGNKRNAIPREAWATVLLPGGDPGAFQEKVEAEFAAVRGEFRVAEPGMRLTVTEAPLPPQVWSVESTRRALQLLLALPHGVHAMSLDIPGLVETSNNLAVVRTLEGTLEIVLNTRSSVASALRGLRAKIRAAGRLAGAGVKENGGYPGWKPDLGSEILGVLKKVHARVMGAEPHVEAVHAGLECGIIGEKIAGMDMISFGPQIEFPHSPNERAHIASVGRFYALLTAVLEELAA